MAGERAGDILEHRYDYVAMHGIGEAIHRSDRALARSTNKGRKAIIFIASSLF